ISMMIMGVAAKVVPVLNGVDSRQLSGLWIAFVLVNVGCAIRVSMQILTDWHDGAFSIIALSGAMEVTGLAWWGISLLAVMWNRRRTTVPTPLLRATAPVAVSAPAIDPDMAVREIAAVHPDLQPTLARLGLDTCCMGE